MRTTVTLSDDVAKAIEEARRERGIGVSEAVNELAQRGLARRRGSPRFEQQTHAMSARVDVSNVWEAVETADGPETR